MPSNHNSQSGGRKSSNTQDSDKGGSTLLAVHREWAKRAVGDPTDNHNAHDDHSQRQSASMLERWQQESALNQPYHTIEEVKMGADLGNSKKTSDRKENSSSVGYDNPKDITK